LRVQEGTRRSVLGCSLAHRAPSLGAPQLDHPIEELQSGQEDSDGTARAGGEGDELEAGAMGADQASVLVNEIGLHDAADISRRRVPPPVAAGAVELTIHEREEKE